VCRGRRRNSVKNVSEYWLSRICQERIFGRGAWCVRSVVGACKRRGYGWRGKILGSGKRRGEGSG